MNEKEHAMYLRLEKLIHAARECVTLYNELSAEWNTNEAKTEDERFPYYALTHANTFRELRKS